MRCGAANQDKLFTRKICVHSHDYSVFIDTGSQASLIRQSVAEQINAKRHKCSMKIRGICGGSCILTEAMTVDLEIDGKTIIAKVVQNSRHDSHGASSGGQCAGYVAEWSTRRERFPMACTDQLCWYYLATIPRVVCSALRRF